MWVTRSTYPIWAGGRAGVRVDASGRERIVRTVYGSIVTLLIANIREMKKQGKAGQVSDLPGQKQPLRRQVYRHFFPVFLSFVRSVFRPSTTYV